MIIQSKKVWLNEEFIPAQIEFVNGKITAIHELGAKEVDEDFGDLKILPGLIDIHNHGYNGMDCNYATEEGIKNWTKSLPAEGVTSFLATSSTAPTESILKSQGLVADMIENPPPGAQILGVHVEGPLINHEYRGAHNPYWIQKPTIELFKKYEEATRNNVSLVCIATEQDDNFALTRYCVEKGIRVVIGHTASKYDACVKAKEAGATSFTHTFNAMVGIHHREPGTAGAALAMDDMYAELICDGVHVHFAVAKIVARMKGKDKLILITDSVRIKGLKPGIYEEDGRWIQIMEDGCGRLKDGRLAGSSNKLIDMVKNCVNVLGESMVVAVNAATINPARFLGVDDRKGLLKVDYDADIIIIDDEFKVKEAFVGGKKSLG